MRARAAAMEAGAGWHCHGARSGRWVARPGAGRAPWRAACFWHKSISFRGVDAGGELIGLQPPD